MLGHTLTLAIFVLSYTFQAMQVRTRNMVTSVQCVVREESCCVVTRVHWPTMSVALIRPYDESRAGTGPVRCALGRTTDGRGAVALKRPL